ncbi:MAG: tetratricopeptide repeat protein [Rhodomicrobium sp.]
MQISKVLRAIKIAAVPVLFAAIALGLTAVHGSLQRKAERARNRAAHAAAVQDDKSAGLKLPELVAAAQNGDIPAQVERARRVALGQGVNKNEGQAALYFQSVINQLGEIGARDKRAPYAATAYRYLAQFHRRGVPGAHITPNSSYAFGLLHHAASYFGDPIAQYELARLLINGEGVTKNPRVGAQWLLRATRKGYVPAQALLGQMLWRGNGVERVPSQGLGLLAIARRNASPDDKAWVGKLYEAARAEALPVEILEANAFIVAESGASPFGMDNLDLIGSEGQDGAEATGKGEAGVTPQSAPGGQQSTIVHGSPQVVSGLRASPMAFGAGPRDRELGVRKSDSKASAGIIQMYRVWEQETRVENSVTVRLAGVTK